jgi:uncharacterized protein
MNRSNPFSAAINGVTVAIVFIAGAFFLPWENVRWGKVENTIPETTTVTGTAETQEKSQIASFTAGATAVKDDKQEAVNEVNSKVEALVASIKNFGIPDKDIKTQNLSIYQDQETYHEDGRQKTRPGQWRVSNSVNITLRDVDKASDLAKLLATGGATNVYGPNFSLDDTSQAEQDLLEQAIENAKQKAEIIATTSGRKLGKVVNVTEGYQPANVFSAYADMGGGGGGIEPGTGTVSKTVTITFELD